MTGENPANLVTKLVSTGFCACVIAGSWQALLLQLILSLSQLEEFKRIWRENAPNPEAAQNFIDFVGTTQT